MIGYYPAAPVTPSEDWAALAEEDEVVAIAMWLIELQQSTLAHLPLRRLVGSYVAKVPTTKTVPTTDAITPGHSRFSDDPVIEHLLLAHGMIDYSTSAHKTHIMVESPKQERGRGGVVLCLKRPFPNPTQSNRATTC